MLLKLGHEHFNFRVFDAEYHIIYSNPLVISVPCILQVLKNI